MYIPAWLIVIAICVGVYFYFKSKKDNNGEPTTVKEMWRQAEFFKGQIMEKEMMEKSPLSGGGERERFEREREMVKAMETDAIRLRERYKHDQEKQKRIAKDWFDYARAVKEIKLASVLLDVDWREGAYDRFDERTKESYAIIHEVAKRVGAELGEESHSKVVHDRLREMGKAMSKNAEKIVDEK